LPKELFGRPLDAPWALEIPIRYRPIGYSNFETFHPTFLYESIWCVFVALMLIQIGKRKQLANGSLFALYVGAYSFGRGLIEMIRIDEANLILGQRLNVWTSLVLLLASAIILYRLNSKEKENQGSKV
jgi:prolipoprotein diacylglyceryltransferase